jgi:subtilisin family serine protease
VQFRFNRVLKGFSGRMSDLAAQAMARNPNVELVEPDRVMTAITTETMDLNGDPWGLDRIDARSGLSGSYSYTGNGSGVTAYIIDTGILTGHSEFGGRASGGFTSINDGNGTADCNGHGTHVAGTVGGQVYGVAKGVTLVAVRVLDCSGSGTTSGVIAGVDWVTANHPALAVANMSLGGGASTALDQAIQNSIASGVSYAVAAGNGNAFGIAQNACNYSPARVPEAMTIGATTKTDVKASWSNYGSCVDWFAPGVGIKSSWIGSNSATNTISGTSMATPHTTGVAALYLAANPGSTPQQVRDGLFNATTKSVVTSSSTTNNHLLYAPPTGFNGGGGPPPNQNPVANFSSSCTNLACNFTDQSTDSDGSVTGWSWNFGDGTSSTSQNPSHSYASAGTYTVALTVTDNQGGTGNTSKSVTVTAPTSATLTVTGSISQGGRWTASLSWSGLTGSSVRVYRNGSSQGTTSNDGHWSDSGRTRGTYTYRVCTTTGSTCTNDASITF